MPLNPQCWLIGPQSASRCHFDLVLSRLGDFTGLDPVVNRWSLQAERNGGSGNSAEMIDDLFGIHGKNYRCSEILCQDIFRHSDCYTCRNAQMKTFRNHQTPGQRIRQRLIFGASEI